MIQIKHDKLIIELHDPMPEVLLHEIQTGIIKTLQANFQECDDNNRELDMAGFYLLQLLLETMQRKKVDC